MTDPLASPASPASPARADAPRAGLPPQLRSVRAAFVFLTRVPLGGFPYSAEDWAWTSAHFPLVGAVIGAVTGGVFHALLPLGPWAAAILAIGASMLLTGAFHEDGLADTADGLGGGYTRERVLEILKDSRIGSFGAAALGVSLLGRAALMAKLGGAAALALPLVGGAARAAAVWLMPVLPYVTASEAAKSRLVTRAGFAQALVATAWLGLLGAGAFRFGVASAPRLLALVAVLACVAAVCGWRFHRRVGGLTGDFLGATEQLCELAALAVLAWEG